MKRLIVTIAILSLVIFSACGGPSAETTSQTSTEEQLLSTTGFSETTTVPEVTTTEPPFDLVSYKQFVNQFRAHVMDNSLLLYNVGNYEVNYLKALGSTSDKTAENGFDWLSTKTDATRDSVDASHQVIREEYAALILVEVSGREAETLDGYVRSMYEGYAALYDCVTSNTFTSSQLTSKINDAIGLINGADRDMGLFLD